MNNTITTYN